MKKPHPAPAMSVPITFEIYQQLTCASASTGFQLEDWEIVALAIQEYLARNNPDTFAMPSMSGLQWKHLFLPSGTVLRTVFNGKNYHCRVDGDQLSYNGTPVSPSGFANAVGGMRRNAWKVIWLLFPHTQTWKLAASLRPKSAPRRPKSQAFVGGGAFARH